ncbi:MAG: hypothetical protein LBI78_00945 [Campylobacteraceae bacterium]|jgi:hypothetical protein|nr:hypothetical protein [Campylobacteraceae bacterium]
MKSYEFLKSEEFVRTIHQTLKEVLSLLLKNDMPFTILTNISRINFEPSLPSSVTQNLQQFTLFAIENYTFSSAKLINNHLVFEAGFGEDDFASLVTVPLGAIVKIIVENVPIFLNISLDITEHTAEEVSKEDKLKKSFEALLNNPENKNLFKK